MKRSRTLVALSLALCTLLAASNFSTHTSAQRRGTRRNNNVARQPADDSAVTNGRDSSTQTRAANPQARPRLVLLIVVDQFRYDFIDRFGDLFAQNGIRRLLRDGASWTNTNYDHTPTYTAPGHATLLTGTYPAGNGIVANDWFDRLTGKRVTSVSDDAAKLLGGDPAGRASSPRRLLASTVGDELRLATSNRAKVVGISIKDRSAILPAGRNANAAYWFSSQTGTFVSSDYYFAQLPSWVARYNETKPADKFYGRAWERLLPAAEYERRAGQDAPTWEAVGGKADEITFPHVITGNASAAAAAARMPDAATPTTSSSIARAPGKEFYEALDVSPFSNDLVLDFAKQAITNERLGADADTDILSVSFSANDYVGHRFGPYSHEAMDMTLRVDRQIGELLDFVDQKVGLRNVVVAFTADHGVAPIPEHASALRLTGGRIGSSEVLSVMRAAVSAKYKLPNEEKDRTLDYIQAFTNGNVYFNYAALQRDRIDRAEIERIVGEAALSVPGITRYFTRTQLLTGEVSETDDVARRVAHGFDVRRSGDCIVMYEPFKYLLDSMITATHGSPYSYDTHVPLVLMSAGVVRAGTYMQAATPADLAPTLAGILRIQPPSNATGRVLVEALAK